MPGLLEDIGRAIINSVTFTARRFAAFIFLVYAVGIVVGSLVAQHRPDWGLVVVIIPIALSFIAYISTPFAVVSFILFTLFILLI